MSNAVKESLEQNLDFILKQTPSEYHDEIKAGIADAKPTPQLTIDEAKKEAIQAIKDNPDVDDKACIPLIEADKNFGKPVEQPSEDELKAEQEEALKKIQ